MALLFLSGCTAPTNAATTATIESRTFTPTPKAYEYQELTLALPEVTPTPPPTPVPTVVPTMVPAYTPAPISAAAVLQGTGQCGLRSSVEQWYALVSSYPWDVCTALRIMNCESGGDMFATNSSSGACGLFQHLPCQHNGDQEANTALAYAKYEGRGWQPWNIGGCYG